MNFVKKLAIFFTVAFSASTILCGISIAQQATFEQSSLDFHMGIGILSLLTTLGTIVLLARKDKKP